jgi:hypothetical protein
MQSRLSRRRPCCRCVRLPSSSKIVFFECVYAHTAERGEGFESNPPRMCVIRDPHIRTNMIYSLALFPNAKYVILHEHVSKIIYACFFCSFCSVRKKCYPSRGTLMRYLLRNHRECVAIIILQETVSWLLTKNSAHFSRLALEPFIR